jgi:hypothetical protein
MKDALGVLSKENCWWKHCTLVYNTCASLKLLITILVWCMVCVGGVINCCSLSDWRCYILLDTSAHMLWCLVQLWVPNKTAAEVWATRGTMQWLLHWLLLPPLLTSPADQRAPEPWRHSLPWYYSILKLVPSKSWNCFRNSFLIGPAS